MYEPVFELGTFDVAPVNVRANLIGTMVEALIAVNRAYLRLNPDTPPFYQSQLKYHLKIRPFGLDRWQDIPTTLALGGGDCKDFVAWRVAELREKGYPDVGPRIIAKETGNVIVYHVQVRIDTQVEDPSVALGMPTNMSAQQVQNLVQR